MNLIIRRDLFWYKRRNFEGNKMDKIKEILEFNDFLKKNVPQEKFINFLNLISKEAGVPLFTSDNKLMSIDRAHLTYFGAREIGKIIFLDIRLNDFR